LNLFDLTGGNYRLQRTILYPEFPESQIMTDAQVTVVSDSDEVIESTHRKHRKASEWEMNLTVNGTYNGPTDVVSEEDYQLIWIARDENEVEIDRGEDEHHEGGRMRQKVLEFGTSLLRLASGGSVRQVWFSTITPEGGFEGFPQTGELLNISISPFKIKGNEMSYEWQGTVKSLPKQHRDRRQDRDRPHGHK
jgi:hypothetical protein